MENLEKKLIAIELCFRFLVPGWRMGWVVVHDRNGAFGDKVS